LVDNPGTLSRTPRSQPGLRGPAQAGCGGRGPPARLLLEGVTRDTRGRGLEWFSVWHRANTVFDIDARVAGEPAGIGREQADRLRSLVRELDSALAELRADDV
jgi:hypothetical protein